MQALHYVPNRSAQLLAGKAAPSIGLITASLTLHAPSQIAAAVKSHASLHQLEVAIAMPAQADFAALQASPSGLGRTSPPGRPGRELP